MSALLACLLAVSALARPAPKPGALPQPAVVDSIVVLNEAEHFAAAESLAAARLPVLEAEEGPGSYAVARLLDAYAAALWPQGGEKADTAMAFAERAIAIKRKLLGPDHPEVARSLSGKASVLTGQRRLEEAIAILKEALAILRRAPDADRGIVGSTCSNIGIDYAMLARYEEATPYLVEALHAYTDAYGENDKDTAAAAYNVGNIFNIRGEYDSAQVYYQGALSSWEACLPPGHPRISAALYSLGNVERLRGAYAASRAYYQKGIDLSEENEGPQSPNLVRNLRGLSEVEELLGNNEDALALRERALHLAETTLAPDSYDLWGELVNLGSSYLHAGRLDAARTYLTRAVHNINARSSEHDELVFPLTELAQLERREGNYQAAVDTLNRALAIATKVLGPSSDRASHVNSLLAAVYEDMGDYAASLPYLDAAIGAFESGWKDPQNYARCLLQRSRVRLAAGETGAAFDDARKGEETAREHFIATLHSLSEREALDFSAFRGNGIPLMISSLLQEGATSGPRVAEAWDAVIRSRSLLLDEIAARDRLVRDAQTPELSELSQAVLDTRTRLANLYLQGPEGQDLEAFTKRLEAASREKENAEAAFAAQSARFRKESTLGSVDEVAANVPAGEALVAYVHYSRPRPGAEPEPCYAAFVLTGGTGQPDLVDLGPAEPIDRAVAAWHDAVAQSRMPSGPLARAAEERVRTEGSALRAAVLDPLLPHLGTSDPVLIVPDGSLHLVNPAALPSPSGGYLVETGPLFRMLPRERAILPGASEKPGAGLLALGGPDFGDPSAVSRNRDDLIASLERNTPRRGAGPDCDQFLKLTFPPLPDAAKEAEEIAALWSGSRRGKTGPATVLVGARATETAFKEKAGGRAVLHLATHGYFLDSECAREGTPDPASEPSGSAALFDLVRGNPLLLSGLALAGSNERWKRNAAENGVLTAEEIASLDLGGVEWVVLSACDTGHGELLKEGGVYGLERAFQTAGARTVIMSLWEVDDAAARDWMKALYASRWRDGRSTAEAVRAASLAMLRDRRKQGQSTSPVTWGAFVATED